MNPPATPSPEFETRVAAAWPPERWADVPVVVAVSGGADSVALLRAFVAIRRQGAGRLVVAHLNHELRAAESDADERFVVELARQLRLPHEVGRAPVTALAGAAGDGIESAAREARYRFLTDVARRHAARYVATAHTADDQAETVLHRILRGTGLAGLAGIPRVRALDHAMAVVRPLLECRRAEVIAYLDQIKQPYRHDSSNDALHFTRNRLRHELLPRLADDYNPSVVEALARLGRLAAEAQAVIEGLAEREFDRRVTLHDAAAAQIDTSDLDPVNRYLLREMMALVWRRQDWPRQAMTFDHWDRLATLALEGGAPTTLPGAITARREAERVMLWCVAKEPV